MSRSFPLISKDKVGGIDASVDRATSPSDLSRQEPSSQSGVDLPDTYRGWKIHFAPPPIPIRDFDWFACSPNYDAWTEDGEWRDNGENALAATRELLIAEIDAWFFENGDAWLGENGAEASK